MSLATSCRRKNTNKKRCLPFFDPLLLRLLAFDRTCEVCSSTITTECTARECKLERLNYLIDWFPIHSLRLSSNIGWRQACNELRRTGSTKLNKINNAEKVANTLRFQMAFQSCCTVNRFLAFGKGKRTIFKVEAVRYIKLFSSLSGVRLIFWMSPNLNILSLHKFRETIAHRKYQLI